MCSARDLQFDHHPLRPKRVPAALCGDWQGEGGRFRFHPNGSFATIHSLVYEIHAGDRLSLMGGAPYARQSGTTGLEGSWRRTVASGELIELTFGPLGYYASSWDGEPAAGGQYVADGNELVVIEPLALFACRGDTITFSYPDGTGDEGFFQLDDNRLEIATPHETRSFVRCTCQPQSGSGVANECCPPVFRKTCAILRAQRNQQGLDARGSSGE